MTEEEIKKFNAIPCAVCDWMDCIGSRCWRLEERDGNRPKCLVQVWNRKAHKLQTSLLMGNLKKIVGKRWFESKYGTFIPDYNIHPSDVRVVVSTDTLNLIKKYDPEFIHDSGDGTCTVNFQDYLPYESPDILIYDGVKTGFVYICERLDWRE